MMSSTTRSGYAAADARRARRLSPFCPLGRHRLATTATAVGNGLRNCAIAEFIQRTYHPCLGLCGRQPYSAAGGKLSMKYPAAEILKQQIPLLDYVDGQ